MNTTLKVGNAVAVAALAACMGGGARAEGVLNGNFTTTWSEPQSRWLQSFPTGMREVEGGTSAAAGLRMFGGRMWLDARAAEGSMPDECPLAADIAARQYQVVLGSGAPYAELEFDVRVELERAYSCGNPPVTFDVRRSVDGEFPLALLARVYEASSPDAGASYSPLGTGFEVTTEHAMEPGTPLRAGWKRYRVTWLRRDTGPDSRYAVEFWLGDIGESAAWFDPETGESGLLRPNQARVQIDNVSLRAVGAPSDCFSSAGSPPSLDVLRFPEFDVRRPVQGDPTTQSAQDMCPVVGPGCTGDLNGDGSVSGDDLGILLGNWGMAGAGDLDGNGVVNGSDLGAMLGSWGDCPASAE
jgi:hypothetical protein